MKRLIRKAEIRDINGYEMNVSLYEENTLKTDPVLKREVIEFIMDNMTWTGESTIEEGYNSGDFNVPNEPDFAEVKATGTLSIATLQQQFGELTEVDFDSIKEELENDNDNDFLSESLNDFIEHPITKANLDETNINVDSTGITIELTTQDVELEK